MPITRFAWVVVPALTLSLWAASQADDSNPFARWDELRRKTDLEEPSAAETAEADGSGAEFEYFSPGDDDTPATAARAGVKRETLKVKTGASASAGSDTGTSAVRNASFTDKDAGPGVRPTSEESPNPFVEFMAEEAAAAETPVETAEPAIPAEAPEFDFSGSANDEPETAAPLIDAPQLPEELSGPQTPQVTLKWDHHDELTLGHECRCDLIVTNSGKSSVRDVTTEIVVPRGLQVISADPAPAATGESARWTFPQLAAGDQRKIELVFVPKQAGAAQLQAFVQFTGATASNLNITQPDVDIRVVGPDEVGVGEQAGYTVHVTNPGTGQAKNVVIQAVIPEGLEHRQGNLLTIEIGTLNPGELRRARLSLTAMRGGEHKLAVRVVADGDLSRESTHLVAVAEPKLNIGVRGPELASTGFTAKYEVAVVNEGNVDSDNVRAKYRVPAGFEFVRANSGGKFNRQDSTIEWFVGTLEPGKVRLFEVYLKASKPGELKHEVGVIGELGGVATAEHTTTVQGSAELTLKVAASDEGVAAGQETTFELRIENTGSSAAKNVGLSCELPPGIELLEISGPSEFIADNGVVIFRSLPAVEPGGTVVFEVRTRCRRAGNHKVRTRVASESVQEPLINEASLAVRTAE